MLGTEYAGELHLGPISVCSCDRFPHILQGYFTGTVRNIRVKTIGAKRWLNTTKREPCIILWMYCILTAFTRMAGCIHSCPIDAVCLLCSYDMTCYELALVVTVAWRDITWCHHMVWHDMIHHMISSHSILYAIRCYMKYRVFLHDRPWVSPWIKSISNEFDIAIHVIASKLSIDCDVTRRTKTERVRHGDDT